MGRAHSRARKPTPPPEALNREEFRLVQQQDYREKHKLYRISRNLRRNRFAAVERKQLPSPPSSLSSPRVPLSPRRSEYHGNAVYVPKADTPYNQVIGMWRNVRSAAKDANVISGRAPFRGGEKGVTREHKLYRTPRLKGESPYKRGTHQRKVRTSVPSYKELATSSPASSQYVSSPVRSSPVHVSVSAGRKARVCSVHSAGVASKVVKRRTLKQQPVTRATVPSRMTSKRPSRRDGSPSGSEEKKSDTSIDFRDTTASDDLEHEPGRNFDVRYEDASSDVPSSSPIKVTSMRTYPHIFSDAKRASRGRNNQLKDGGGMTCPKKKSAAALAKHEQALKKTNQDIRAAGQSSKSVGAKKVTRR